MSVDTTELDGKLDQLIARGNEIKAELETKVDESRLTELTEEQTRLRDQVAAINAERETAKAKAEHDLLMQFMEESKQQRRPSKAAALSGHPEPSEPDPMDSFFVTVAKAKRGDSAAKAQLDAWGSVYSDAPAASKATLGTTDGTGGYLIPNAVVADIIEQATARNPWRQILDVQTGIRGIAVDQPTEGLAPVRATIVGWGDTKENTNFTVNNYTATLYTLARIYDVANQFLRHSEGAAERLVRSRLARALALGESYYILNGSGSSEPKGILTSVGTSGDFVTSFTPAATLAGSVASAIATAAGDLEGRNREATAAVVHPAVYWLLARQGTDEAGFFFSPAGGPEGIRPGTLMSPFGIPVIKDANMPNDDLLVGDFKSIQLWIGDDYRVDVSSEAGDRWDKNLTGFRGEEEIAFNADAAVASGFVQRILDVTP